MRYGGYLAVSGVSLEVGAGEVACLMGANGSGKSSVMNAVSGLVRPAAGDVVFDGESITAVPTHALLGRGLGHVLERRRLFPYMSVLDNLLLGAYLPALRPARARRLDEVLALFPRSGRSSASSPTRCPAASSRWCRSPARSSASRASSCWTSRSSGSRRASCRRSPR